MRFPPPPPFFKNPLVISIGYGGFFIKKTRETPKNDKVGQFTGSIQMAYCDYLYRRNGVFYFRYDLKEDCGEIRFSLKTRKKIQAKRLSAMVLTSLILNKGVYEEMSKENLLKVLTTLSRKELEAHENKDAISKIYSVEKEKIEWVNQHLPEEKTQNLGLSEIVALYDEYFPIYSEAKRKKIKSEAEHFYNIPREKNKKIEDEGLKISEISDLYCREMLAGGNWREKTHEENLKTHSLFIQLQGDVPANQLTIKNFTEFKDQLQKIPKNFNKLCQTKNKSIRDVVEQNHGLEKISIRTINKHLNKISTLLKWGKKNGYCIENFAEGMGIKHKVNHQLDRLPFTDDELTRIFIATSQLKSNKHSYYYWLPILALFTGARINELSQLDVIDIFEENGIYYIDINDNGDGKRLKNLSSKRKIPIHPKLIKLKFLDFVFTEKAKGSTKLFSSIKLERDGFGQNPSKWFGRLKKKMNLQDSDRKGFHSFRHNVSDALQNAEVPEQVAAALLGHLHENITFGRYGSGSGLVQLHKAVKKIKYDIDI